MKLSVPERGFARIPKDIWPRLAADQGLWTLVRDKILSIESPGVDRMLLRGSCYVGRAVLGGVVVELAEKFPGAFRALCTAALPDKTRLVETPSAVGDSPFTTGLLVKVFIEAVQRYVAASREFCYTIRRERGSLIGGKLDIAQTIRLRARGVRHQVSFSRTSITTVTDLNVIICAALLRVEMLSRSQIVDRDSVIAARSLTMVFTECQEAVARSNFEELRELASHQANARSDEKGIEAHVAELAAAILGEAGFGDDSGEANLVRRSWFVNLENMFERAVRNCFVGALGGTASVTSAVSAPGVFIDLIARYPANPDVVIRSGNGICIGDAKYKNRRPREWPEAGEVQELLTHASAYGAKRAFLMFPAEEQWRLRLGTDRNGCEAWGFGVRLDKLLEDIDAAVITLGLAEPEEVVA